MTASVCGCTVGADHVADTSYATHSMSRLVFFKYNLLLTAVFQ